MVKGDCTVVLHSPALRGSVLSWAPITGISLDLTACTNLFVRRAPAVTGMRIAAPVQQ